jgi:prephenate dehydratase
MLSTMIKKVAIQGIRGAFHEEAAIQFFNNEKIDIVPALTFDELIQSVSDNNSNLGIMAIENSISGTIHTNLELIRNSELSIIGETYIRIQQNFAIHPEAKIENIKKVKSHFMALNQCRKYFRQFPNMQLIESKDTALSMREITEANSIDIGAIGSMTAIKNYGLKLVTESIETNKNNYTRFVILSREKNRNTEINKASLSLILPHKAGSLSKVLSLISFYGADLTKIESTPILGKPWSYRFYIDLRFDDETIFENVITSIKPLVEEIQILGKYTDGIQSFNQIHMSYAN